MHEKPLGYLVWLTFGEPEVILRALLWLDERMFLEIRFGWVGFYGISTIVGYLMPNFVFTYISNMICKHIL